MEQIIQPRTHVSSGYRRTLGIGGCSAQEGEKWRRLDSADSSAGFVRAHDPLKIQF